MAMNMACVLPGRIQNSAVVRCRADCEHAL